MDIAAILALVQKGLSVASAIYEAGKNAAPAIQAISALVTGAQKGTVTDEEIAATEALLDQLIADFNVEI
jgi:hypothetical protein